MWMVRAREHGRLFDDFRKHSIVAIGWHELGDLSNIHGIDEVQKKVEEVYKGEKPGSNAMTTSQVSRFRFSFKESDYAITYNAWARTKGRVRLALTD
jgi:predicted Mrr-cat superfamily restriction endonuclease